MLIATNIPSLLNGVSQQPATQRFSSQAEDQVNAYSSVVEGLGKRPCTEFIGKLLNSNITASSNFVHGINRDATERYIVVIGGTSTSNIRVYDLNGTQKTVNTPDGTTYLNTSEKARDIRCVTIGDYTFVLNKSITAAIDSTTTAARNPEALFVVENGVYHGTYTIKIGTFTYTHITGGSSAQGDCVEIAAALMTLITATPPTGVTVTREGYVLHAQSTSSADFNASVSDGLGGIGLRLIKGSVQSFTDLPTLAQNNMYVKVEGVPGAVEDDYYVKFTAKNGGFGEGTWSETIAPSVKYKFNYTTMPHVLIRLSDGTFVFKKADGVQYSSYVGTDAGWSERQVGDDVTNPLPSFVGQKINDIFLFKDRLGFLANESVIMSETAEYFQFWRTTTTQIIDSDPIDVQSGFPQVSVLRSAVPISDRLVIFSDKAQFIVQGGQVFTPTTVSMTAATRYEMTSDMSPVSTGKTVFFPILRSGNTGIREFQQSEQDPSLFDAPEVTAAVPKYIPSICRTMAFNSMESVLAVLPPYSITQTPSEMYIYKFFGSGSQRIQSSWSKFTFGAMLPIGMAFFDNWLYIVHLNATDNLLYLSRMDFSPNQRDLAEAGTEYAAYKTLLDERVDEKQCTVTYNSGTDQTTVVFPQARQYGGTFQIVSRRAYTGTAHTNYGEVFYSGVPSSNTLVIPGKLETTPGTVAFYAGFSYQMLYEFSEITLKAPRQSGGQELLSTGRLQLRYCTIQYANSGYFETRVVPDYGDSSIAEWTGNDLGLNNAILGQMNISDGKFKFAVYQKSDEVRVRLLNDTFLPSNFLSAEFECLYSTRSKRV